MEGGKDPDNRRAFPWDKLSEGQNKPIYSYVKDLIELRKKNRVLRDGSLEISCNSGCMNIVRALGKKKMTLSVSMATPDPVFEIC
jgi:hypothetical protein